VGGNSGGQRYGSTSVLGRTWPLGQAGSGGASHLRRGAGHCHGRQPAMRTRNTIFTMTIPSVIIPSRASESSGGAICRPCGVIVPASHPASRSSGFSEEGISGSRNTQSRTRATGIHGEYHGVPQPQGRPRSTTRSILATSVSLTPNRKDELISCRLESKS
jgi:hypothetical protein